MKKNEKEVKDCRERQKEGERERGRERETSQLAVAMQ